MKDFIFSDFLSLHFIGIGGVSMSALAKYCLNNGVIVTGSDRVRSEFSRDAEAAGVTVYYDHSKNNLSGALAVVYTSAISEDNVELVEAKRRGIPVIKRSELLGAILNKHEKSVAVSGCHGKTTTTAMLTEIFVKAKKDPTAFIGGNYPPFGNFRQGDGRYAIAEACEYRKNFLDLTPSVAVVLNIDDDHKDSFRGLRDETEAFSHFISGSLAVINADDKYAEKLFNACTVTFGIESRANFTAKRITENCGAYSFDFYAYGRKKGRVKLKIRGRHNVYNALAALAVSDISGIPFSASKSALEAFAGVKRRNERIGTFCGRECIADYAHHPTEIVALLNSYREEKPVVVFQPHTYSRTKYLLPEFVSALTRAEKVVIYKTYPAREKFDEDGSAERLYRELKAKEREKVDFNAYYASSPEKLKEVLSATDVLGTEENKGKILFVGAGDIYEIALNLTEKVKG